jgi:hypothetical protein
VRRLRLVALGQVQTEEVPKHRPFARASLVDGLAELELAARGCREALRKVLTQRLAGLSVDLNGTRGDKC